MNARNVSTKPNVAKVSHRVNRRVGIFAGSFDPIHNGHIGVAKSAIEHLELDILLFMVEEKPWTTKTPVDSMHRKAMVDTAVNGEEKIGQYNTTDERFNIQKTLPKIEASYPEAELYFIFGADVFLRMNSDQWPGLDKLLAHYIVVFERQDCDESEISNHVKELGCMTAIFPSPLPHHSSTDVRKQPHNKQIWVPQVVADYIENNNLYQD